MKIALIQEESQKKKNEFFFRLLEQVANKYHHEVFNYGVEDGKNLELDEIGAGVLTAILLNSHAVDFVITGSSDGEGVLLCANSMPGVFCGYITDPIDMELFIKRHDGNAISLPFGKNFGIGSDLIYEQIFKKIFTTEKLSGYPKEQKEKQAYQKKTLEEIKWKSQIRFENILEELDKDLLRSWIHNDYFEENFFLYSQNDEIAEYLKDIIDA